MTKCKAKPYLIAVLCAQMAACATQTYQAKPIEPVQSLARFESRSLDSPELRIDMVAQGYPEQKLPVEIWGLNELTLAAFHYHPQLEVARAQWQSAQAAAQTAAQKPNPSINPGGEHHSKTDGGVSPWTLGFSLSIPFEASDKRAARMARAANLSEAARIEIGQVAWQVRSRLRQQYVEYQSTLQQIDLLKRELALREEIVQMLQTRMEAGMVSDIELTNARLLAQKTQQSLLAEHGKLPSQLAGLAEAVGLPAEALNGKRIATLPPLPDATPAALQRSALLNRLDLRAALARYAAAESKLQLEIARQRPDITLSPGYSFDQGDNKWSFGLSMILALLNRNEGPIAEAEAQRAVEMQQFEALQQRIIGEAEQAHARYRAALEEIAKAEKLLSAQRQRTAQSERQYDAGYIDRLEMTGTRLELLNAEEGLAAARNRAQVAVSALEESTQRPLDPTLNFPLPADKVSRP